MREVERAEKRGADAELLEKYKAKCVELTKIQEELAALRRVVASVRMAVGDRP